MRRGDPVWIRHWRPESQAIEFRGTHLGSQGKGSILVRWEEGPLRGRDARVPARQVRPRKG